MPDVIELSVVIPALDERANLEFLLPLLRRVLAGVTPSYEILIVDGGSKDGTSETAIALGARVVTQREPGFGRAVWEGIRASRGTWVLTMDADGSHDPWYIPSLYAARDRADVVAASRYVPKGGAQCARYRDLLSRLLNGVSAWVCGVPVRDSSGGFKLYRRSIFDEFELTRRDFNVQMEAVLKALAYGYRVIELPYTYKERRTGASHAKIVAYGWSFLRTIVWFWRVRNTVFFCDYDERAARSRFLPQRWWHRGRHRRLARLMEATEPALDAGCGSSHFILSRPAMIGLDSDRRKARFIRDCHPRTVVGSVTKLPFRDAAFSQVVSSEVIEHVPGQDSVLRELARVVRPGGVLILSTPDYGRGPWRAIEALYKLVMPGGYADEHVSHYDQGSLGRLLEGIGFRVEAWDRMFWSILFVKARKVPG